MKKIFFVVLMFSATTLAIGCRTKQTGSNIAVAPKTTISEDSMEKGAFDAHVPNEVKSLKRLALPLMTFTDDRLNALCRKATKEYNKKGNVYPWEKYGYGNGKNIWEGNEKALSVLNFMKALSDVSWNNSGNKMYSQVECAEVCRQLITEYLNLSELNYQLIYSKINEIVKPMENANDETQFGMNVLAECRALCNQNGVILCSLLKIENEDHSLADLSFKELKAWCVLKDAIIGFEDKCCYSLGGSMGPMAIASHDYDFSDLRYAEICDKPYTKVLYDKDLASKADSIYNDFHKELSDISSLKNKTKVERDGKQALKHLKYAYTNFMRCRSQVVFKQPGEAKTEYENNTRRYSNGILDIFNDELF